MKQNDNIPKKIQCKLVRVCSETVTNTIFKGDYDCFDSAMREVENVCGGKFDKQKHSDTIFGQKYKVTIKRKRIGQGECFVAIFRERIR